MKRTWTREWRRCSRNSLRSRQKVNELRYTHTFDGNLRKERLKCKLASLVTQTFTLLPSATVPGPLVAQAGSSAGDRRTTTTQLRPSTVRLNSASTGSTLLPYTAWDTPRKSLPAPSKPGLVHDRMYSPSVACAGMRRVR